MLPENKKSGQYLNYDTGTDKKTRANSKSGSAENYERIFGCAEGTIQRDAQLRRESQKVLGK